MFQWERSFQTALSHHRLIRNSLSVLLGFVKNKFQTPIPLNKVAILHVISMYIYFNLLEASSHVNTFSLTTILQQMTFNMFCQKIENLYNWMDKSLTKSGKHCGKGRNCLFWAISYFVTMFSKSCLLQRCQKESIWGNVLTLFFTCV